MENLLIMGIDPGTTLGYAILDIDGNVIEVNSSKLIKFHDLIRRVIEIGKVLLIGTDKSAIPKYVYRFATKLGATVISPKEDLLVNEKRELTKGLNFKDYHQMDALAGALLAYNSVKDLIKRIDKFLEEEKKENLREEVILKVIIDKTSISKAVNEIEQPEEEVIIKKVIEEKKPEEKDYVILYNKLVRVKKELNYLKMQNENLLKEISQIRNENKILKERSQQNDYNKKIDQLFRFKEQRIQRFSSEIENKNKEIKNLYEEIKQLMFFLSNLNDYALAKKINNLGFNEIEKKAKMLNIKEDILLVDDPNIFSEKSSEFISNIVITKKPASKKVKGIFKAFFIDAGKFEIIESKDFALIPKKQLEKERASVEMLDNIIKKFRDNK